MCRDVATKIQAGASGDGALLLRAHLLGFLLDGEPSTNTGAPRRDNALSTRIYGLSAVES